MRPATTLIAIAISFLVCAPAHAQFVRQGGDIDITADYTEFVDAENLVRVVGRVNVRQGDAQLLADQMDVYLSDSSGGERVVERIEAEGAVAYVTPLEVARGDSGVYLAASEQITLLGNVTLIRGDTTLAGEQLVINSVTGRSSLTRTTPSGSRANERVRAVFSAGGESSTAEDVNDEGAQ